MRDDNEDRLLRWVAQQNVESIRLARRRAERQAEATLWEQANLLNLTHDAIFVRDMKGIVRYWNRGAEELYGWTAEQAVGRVVHHLLKTVFPVSREDIEAEVIRTGRWEGEVTHTKKDGGQIIVESRWALQRDGGGAPVAILVSNTDITKRQRAEALLAGEKRILEMVAKGDSLPQILDSLCRLVEEQAGGVLASILLLDGNRLRHGGAPSLPKAYTHAIDGSVIGPSAGSCGTAAYRGQQVIVEDIATDPLWANYRDVALSHCLRACWSTPVFSSQGKVIATFAMYYREPRRPSLRDQEIIEQITHLAGAALQRKLTEEKLRKSEAYLAEAERLTHTGSWAYNPATWKPTYWSDEMFRIWGFAPELSIAPDLEARVARTHQEDRDRVRARIEKAFREGIDYAEDYRIVLPDGTVKHLHAIGHPVFDEAGEIVEYVGTTVDVTGRKRAEDALRRSEAYLTEAERLSHTGSWAWDPSGRKVLYCSEETFRIFGLEPQASLPSHEPRELILQRIHPEDRDRVVEDFKKALLEKVDNSAEYKIVLPDGTVKHIQVVRHAVLNDAGDVTEVVGTLIDVTERKRAEEEREKLRRLEADLAHINRVSMMGELDASLAHELNQPITAAVTNARTCLRWLTRDDPDLEEAREAARRIVNDGTRAAEIITRIRSLYTKRPPHREVVDVNAVAGEMLALLRDEATRHAISMRADLAADLPTVTADRVQLQQVFMNLMLNGIEAMHETPGDLVITSQRSQDGHVLVSISDTGVGLPAEKADQIFSAFFTTKPEGTGMGLAISRSIIESHGGRLWATPNPWRGATFNFTLPGSAQAS